MKKPVNKQIVLDYFQTLRIRPARNIDQFWSNLRQKYDHTLINDLQKIVEARADGCMEGDLYELKNQSMQLGLDFSAFSADLYRRFFDWLLASNITMPARVLDIGCDNGIVTCFLAKHYPDSEFLGIDLTENGIKAAQELAIKLDLKNVTFQRMSAFEVHDTYSNYFNMIISVRSLHEILDGFTKIRFWSIKDFESNISITEQIGEMTKILNALAPGGQLVAFERLHCDADIASFIKMLNLSGLSVNEYFSSMISFQEVGKELTMPAIVFEKSPDAIYSTGDILLSIYHLRNEDLPVLERGTNYEGFLAEAFVEQISDKELIKGVNIIFNDGSGTMRCEIWQNEQFIFAYNYTNIGFRSINIFDKEYLDTAMKELEKVRDEYALLAACTYYNAQSEL